MIKRALRYLLGLREKLAPYKGPLLQDHYDVCDNDSVLARITVCGGDWPWTFFQITPLTDASDKLDKLYSDDFWWSKDIHIREIDSGQEVQFTLALQIDDNEEPIDVMEKRPSTVQLRGPHKIG